MNTPADSKDATTVPGAGERNGTHVDRDEDVDRGGEEVERSKFDLGQRPADLPTENIPWGYGEDRITALARDPDWLYLYWELTDEGIAEARSRLGEAGPDAWLCLRVYDTTGRVFDGTNAIDSFDIAIERASRDWFVHIARPATSAHVDVGLKTRDGAFRTIARSGRADFPRKRPSPDMTLQWLSVTSASGGEQSPTSGPYQSRFAGPAPKLDASAPSERPVTPPPPAPDSVHRAEHRELAVFWKTTWQERRLVPWSMTISHRYETSYQRVATPWFMSTWRSEWQGDRRAFEWFTPLHAFAWAGSLPGFEWIEGPVPLELDEGARVVMRLVGPTQVIAEWGGEQSFVYGPWEVVIRSFQAEPARRVLGSWVMQWVRPVEQRWERWETPWYRAWLESTQREIVALGASESQHWAERGVAELWMLGASESLWLGGSEMVSLGASELSFLGGSEWALAGGSETLSAWARVQLGASEQLWLGASEQLLRGASEQWLQISQAWSAAGASEVMVAGASEQWASGVHVFGAASEQVGASEQLGASEQWFVGASEQALRDLGQGELGEVPQAGRVGGSEQRLGGASELVPGGASELGPPYSDSGSSRGDADKGGA